MYALVIYFDQHTTEHIKSIRRYFNKEGISDYDANNLAHMTIASFENLDVNLWIEDIESHLFSEFSLTLSSLGSFVGSETLYFAPTMTKEMYDFHSKYYHRMEAKHSHHKMYSPNYWIPHITIASRLGVGFSQALDYVRNQSAVSASVEKVALINVFIDEIGNACGSEIVWERMFQ